MILRQKDAVRFKNKKKKLRGLIINFREAKII